MSRIFPLGLVLGFVLMSVLGCDSVTTKPFGMRSDGGILVNVDQPTGGMGGAEGGKGGNDAMGNGGGGSSSAGGRQAGGHGGTANKGGAGGHGGVGGAPATGGAATGGAATGGAATGGAATGGAATGGAATGGAATGGAATGGAATGGVAAGGAAMGGSSNGGSLGAGGSSGRSCSEISDEYDTAVPSAQVCSVAATTSCTATASDKLGCNSCLIPVQDDSKLAPLQKEWNALGCSKGLLCTAVKCPYQPNHVAACDGTGSAARAKGTCVWQAGATIPAMP